MAYVLLIVGLALLLVSGELLVKGAVNLAYTFKISTLVVGMTIISFGTSAPELLVSLKATLQGHPDIAVGNVVGSNIANIALVLGLTALIFPIAVDRNTVRTDWPMMMLASLLFIGFSYNQVIVWWEGLVLFGLLAGFIVFIILKSRKQLKVGDHHKRELSVKRLLQDIGLILVGALGLMLGADWLVDGAVQVARSFGVSDLVISVTIVAFGTSAPELITSCIAAFKKHTDISVGNLIGSNIFNIMAIMGITPMVKAVNVSEQAIKNDMLWMLGVAVVLLPMFLTNRKITRLEGGMLFLVYLSYIAFQIL